MTDSFRRTNTKSALDAGSSRITITEKARIQLNDFVYDLEPGTRNVPTVIANMAIAAGVAHTLAAANAGPTVLPTR